MKDENPTPTNAINEDLLALVPPLKPLPWEDAEACSAFEAEVMSQLRPANVHQRALARDIADCIWQIWRACDTARCIDVAGYKMAVIELLGDPFDVMGRDTSVIRLAWLLTTPERRSEGLAALAEGGFNEDTIKAKAYHMTAHENEALHRRVIQLEERRRRLMADYRELVLMAETFAPGPSEDIGFLGD